MGYEAAISKAWNDLEKLSGDRCLSVKFLADEYSIDPDNRRVLSLSCNAAARDFTAILILHYCAKLAEGLPGPAGEWLTFKELARIEGYEAAFRQRSIVPVIRKYGKNPAGIYDALKRLPGRKAEGADAGIIVDTFPAVPVLVKIWAGDDEFAAEANMLFDKNVTGIFCIEDIVVLAGLVAGAL